MYGDRYATSQSVIRFDLEDPTHLARLESPKLALEGLHGLVVIDEVQRVPGLSVHRTTRSEIIWTYWNQPL